MILDAPCGSGWLRPLFDYDCQVDGLDLSAAAPPGYRLFRHADLDLGLPGDLATYDAIVCGDWSPHPKTLALRRHPSLADSRSDNPRMHRLPANAWFLPRPDRGFRPILPQ